MKRLIHLSIGFSFLTLVSLLAAPGCNKPATPPTDGSAQKPDKEKDKKKHAHGETGPHKGPLAEWGDEVFHAEFTLDTAHQLAVIYMLDGDGKKAPKEEVSKFSKMKLNITSVDPTLQLNLKHDPSRSDAIGLAFIAKHEHFAKDVEMRGSIDGMVEGHKELFIGDFKYKPISKSADDARRQLYLKPGGIYTAADIKANGTEKFKDLGLDHVDPEKGDKICPVTGSKAHKEYGWVVQGQTYHFCCPPCLDTFLKWAHHEPGKIKNAKEYVKGM